MNENQSIYLTINKARKIISEKGLGKNQKNTLQNYMYRGIDDLYQLICGVLTDAGLIISPDCVSHELESVGKTSKGADIYRSKVMMQYIFNHIYNDQTFVVSFPGEASDSSDKATNKSTTSAFKYFIIQFFDIPITGIEGDPDSGYIENLEEDKTITVEKVRELANSVKVPKLISTQVRDAIAEATPERLEKIYNLLLDCDRK